MVIMVTGGAGFIGSNFVRYWLQANPADTVVNVDALTYAGVMESNSDVKEKYEGRYFFEKADICDFDTISRIVSQHHVEVIVNFAAESHNSYAIVNPTAFYRTNVIGTQTLLEVVRKSKLSRFHHISTCEVYGDLALDSEDMFTEDSPLVPNTPYNASKAAADMAVRAHFKTFDTPVTISNCSNNFGPYQFPEKLIPLFVTNLLRDKPVTLYKESANKREWLHVEDHCRAIELILKKGKIGETYNVGSGIEKSVEEISEIILKALNMPDSYKTYVASRPSHDRRYLLDSSKIRRVLGWQPEIEFDEGVKQTINWYQNNEAWWSPLIDRIQLDEGSWGK